MRFSYFLTAVVSAVSVVGQTACISKFTNMLNVLYAFPCLLPAKNVNKNALQIVAMLYVGVLYVLYVSKHAQRADFSTISTFVKFLMPCSTTGAFTSYTDLVLKAFYSGNPTPVPIYVKNVLTVPHTGYDILSVSFSSEIPLHLSQKKNRGSDLGNIQACTSTPCSTSKTYMTLDSGKLRPWVPGNAFLQTVSLPVIDGASPPFIAQNPLPPGSASYCGMVSSPLRACFETFLTKNLCSRTKRPGVNPSSP